MGKESGGRGVATMTATRPSTMSIGSFRSEGPRIGSISTREALPSSSPASRESSNPLARFERSFATPMVSEGSVKKFSFGRTEPFIIPGTEKPQGRQVTPSKYDLRIPSPLKGADEGARLLDRGENKPTMSRSAFNEKFGTPFNLANNQNRARVSKTSDVRMVDRTSKTEFSVPMTPVRRNFVRTPESTKQPIPESKKIVIPDLIGDPEKSMIVRTQLWKDRLVVARGEQTQQKRFEIPVFTRDKAMEEKVAKTVEVAKSLSLQKREAAIGVNSIFDKVQSKVVDANTPLQAAQIQARIDDGNQRELVRKALDNYKRDVKDSTNPASLKLEQHVMQVLSQKEITKNSPGVEVTPTTNPIEVPSTLPLEATAPLAEVNLVQRVLDTYKQDGLEVAAQKLGLRVNDIVRIVSTDIEKQLQTTVQTQTKPAVQPSAATVSNGRPVPDIVSHLPKDEKKLVAAKVNINEEELTGPIRDKKGTKQDVEKIVFIKDKRAEAARLFKAQMAIVRAFLGNMFTYQLIQREIPAGEIQLADTSDVKSEIAGNNSDGTIAYVNTDIRRAGIFRSMTQAALAVKQAIEAHVPVKKAKEGSGEEVRLDDVLKVIIGIDTEAA